MKLLPCLVKYAITQMQLTKLVEYANTQMNLPPEMYLGTRVHWLIDLKPDGTLEGFIPLRGDTTNQQSEFVVPHIQRSSSIKPKLLADSGEYVLGIARIGSKPERVAEAHRQFKALVQKCANATQEPSVQAVTRFLSSWQPHQASLPTNFNPSDVITFRVEGVIPAAELQRVQKFWADYTAGREHGNKTDPIMTCLVTGKVGPVEERLPVKIKGIPNGQPTGTALVSANAPAFASYGLKNSLTSPISRDAAERFAKALNHLIATENSRMYIGPIVYVFWTQQKAFNYFEFLERPQPQAVKNLLESVYTSQQNNLQANQFYALALSALSGRAVVRDWLETTITNVESSLKRSFAGQKIVAPDGEPGRPLGVYTLAASAYRDANKEMTPGVLTALIRVALNSGRLPNDLLARVVRRNRVERDVTYPRAALIKLILTTQNHKETMAELYTLTPNPELEDESDRAAYQCGRLLAELEVVQRFAIGNINTSLTDRYYGSASSTPAIVFAPLLREARVYLGKLRKSSPSLCNTVEERIEEILSNLPKFPETLTMPRQSLFALGYYHQRASDRAAAKAAKTSKKSQLN